MSQENAFKGDKKTTYIKSWIGVRCIMALITLISEIITQLDLNKYFKY